MKCPPLSIDSQLPSPPLSLSGAVRSGPGPGPTPQSAGGWVGKLLLLFILLLAVAAAVAWTDYQRFAATPLPLDEARVFNVERGDSLRSVVGRLADDGLTPQWRQYWWQALAWQGDTLRRLQVGEYSLPPGLDPAGLLQLLASGRVIQHRFTVVEGWSFSQLRQALAAAEPLTQTLADQSDAQIMAALGAAERHPEGWFLPETYAYTRGTTDLALLRRAHQAMQEALADTWRQRSPGTAVDNPEQLLILASIIEKETGKPSERRQVAGVFSRRLAIGMRLQTDPTVIYGLGSAFDGNLRRNDLRTDTPYNTYTRAGLPPTPIAMPGRAALRAAADPADGNALYFVSRGDGSHHFSPTYDEHRRAVQRYQIEPARQRRAAQRAGGDD